MNFLELCQRTVSESGTMSGATLPSSVVNQSGRLKKVVGWVQQAWLDIQNRHSTWLWMRGEFTGSLTGNNPRYTAASFSLSRWSYWINEENCLSLYDPAIGVGDEGALTYIPWQQYRQKYLRGSQTNNRPVEFTISPAGELCFGPIPDKTYTVRGEYQKSAQPLAANGDTPEMPADFHMLVVWDALLYLDEHDEAALNKAQRRRQDVEVSLENSQLPNAFIGSEPLA